MPLAEADVRKVAYLARLHLSDEEVARMTEELDAIVDYVGQLQEVDTEGWEPVANIAGLHNITRPDVPGTMMTPAEALANAPKATDEAFLVPKAVER